MPFENTESVIKPMKMRLSILATLALAGCSTLAVIDPQPELHSIGVYEGSSPDDDGIPWHQKCGNQSPQQCHRAMTQQKRSVGGQVTVNVAVTGKPLILAFSAYDKTQWIVESREGVRIEKVILSGYHAQSITGIPPNTPIEVYTHDHSPCDECTQGEGYFYSYQRVPERLEDITGLSASSWQGKYQGEEFNIVPDAGNPRQRTEPRS